ncbi:MAG: pyridoxamine 5'-phosphate oxidase [Ignavibacteriae bacterium]|nr:pyridoxamine 5'-phosphate oxidase [Ignavibacteriota bacterium]
MRLKFLFQRLRSLFSQICILLKPLDERTVHPDPIRQFERWFEEAVKAKLFMPEAMTLATATKDGKPSARLVLLKQVDEKGFVFFGNYNSRKGNELAENPEAALVFYWSELLRQVRIEGLVKQISAEESDQYFRTRPRDSQISAHASPQSKVVGSRAELERLFHELEQRYNNQLVPRPTYWGGYRLKPHRIEFWQSREARLHDRVAYILQSDGSWKIHRLAP